jgi:hypothetical protein
MQKKKNISKYLLGCPPKGVRRSTFPTADLHT